MLTDVARCTLALLAVRFARKPPTPEKTYGYYRVEILAALANAVIVLGISALILYQAYRRFLEPPDVLGIWTLTPGKYAMSGHVTVDNFSAGNRIIREIHELLHERFAIEHTTIQIESQELVQIEGPASHAEQD